MKDGISIPTMDQLLAGYNALQSGGSVEPDQLVKLGLWTHFDPRLMEIWVASMARQWSEINPVSFNRVIVASQEPTTFGVLLETLHYLILRQQEQLYLNWMRTSLTGVMPLDFRKIYFIGLNKLAGREVQKDLQQNLYLYKKWGYIGRELALHQPSNTAHPFIEKEERILIIESLTQKTNRITVSDYLQALNFAISRRQAERDLRECLFLRPRGETKGRYYYRSLRMRDK